MPDADISLDNPRATSFNLNFVMSPDVNLFNAPHIPNIRNYYYPALIRYVAELADHGWTPTVTDAEALICVMTEQVADRWDVSEDFRAENPISWPAGLQQTEGIISDGQGYCIDEERQLIASSNVLGDIVDNGEAWDGIGSFLPKLVEHMNDDAKAELSLWILDHMPTFNAYYRGKDADKIGQLFDTIATIDPYSTAAVRVGERFAQFLEENIGTRGISESPDFEGDGSSEQWYLYSATTSEMQLPLYRYLSTKACSEERSNILMGILLRCNGVARELNTMRDMLHTGKMSKEESDNLEGTLRSILGLLADKPVYTNLPDLYAAIRFEEYHVGMAMQQEITATTIDLLKKYHVDPNDNVLELGSGTGWLVGGLREKGFQARGVDASVRNVSVATQAFGDHFQVGSWEQVREDPESQKAVLSLGRSLPHTEEEARFYTVITQARRVVSDGGVFLFDMPDSTQGGYWENVQRYRAVLRKFGFSEEELADQWIVVDSPDGEHFYNRFVPTPTRIRKIFNNMGFAVREEVIQDIPTGKGDKNIVFVGEKLANPVWEASAEA